MKEQNFKTHRRVDPLFHLFLTPLMIAILIVAGGNLYRNIDADNNYLYPAILIFVMSLVILILSYVARSFALKAQDRAIRAEENLRFFAITGKLMDSKLSLKQIIALRFAANNELLDLEHRAIAENLSADEIKKSIKHWRADHHRV